MMMMMMMMTVRLVKFETVATMASTNSMVSCATASGHC